MTKVQQPAQWAGRLLLVGAVAFRWSVVVVLRLISLVFPDWLHPHDLLRWVYPGAQGSIANSVSEAALATTALLALGNAVASHRR